MEDLKEFKLTSIDSVEPLKEMMVVKFISEKREYTTKAGLIVTTMLMSDTPEQDARLKPREHAPGMGLYQIVKMGEKDVNSEKHKVQLNENDYILAFDLDSQQTINKLPIGDTGVYFLVNQFLACAKVNISAEDIKKQTTNVVLPPEPPKPSNLKLARNLSN